MSASGEKGSGKGRSMPRFLLLLAIAAVGLPVWWFGFRSHDLAVAADPLRGVPRPKAKAADTATGVIFSAKVQPRASLPLVEAPVLAQVAVGPSGRITTAAMEELGLNEEQAAQLGNKIRETMEEVKKDFAARTKLVESREEKAGTYVKYYTEARTDGGQGVLDALEQRFTTVVGARMARQLTEGLGDFDFGGGLGRDALEFEFIPQDTEMAVLSRTFDHTGQQISSMRSGLDSFQDKYGEMFEIPAQGRGGAR